MNQEPNLRVEPLPSEPMTGDEMAAANGTVETILKGMNVKKQPPKAEQKLSPGQHKVVMKQICDRTSENMKFLKSELSSAALGAVQNVRTIAAVLEEKIAEDGDEEETDALRKAMEQQTLLAAEIYQRIK